MRKTRLVLVPGARSLNRLFCVLLYLSCPNIGALCREKLDLTRDDLYSPKICELDGDKFLLGEYEKICCSSKYRINNCKKTTGKHCNSNDQIIALNETNTFNNSNFNWQKNNANIQSDAEKYQSINEMKITATQNNNRKMDSETSVRQRVKNFKKSTQSENPYENSSQRERQQNYLQLNKPKESYNTRRIMFDHTKIQSNRNLNSENRRSKEEVFSERNKLLLQEKSRKLARYDNRINKDDSRFQNDRISRTNFKEQHNNYMSRDMHDMNRLSGNIQTYRTKENNNRHSNSKISLETSKAKIPFSREYSRLFLKDNRRYNRNKNIRLSVQHNPQLERKTVEKTDFRISSYDTIARKFSNEKYESSTTETYKEHLNKNDNEKHTRSRDNFSHRHYFRQHSKGNIMQVIDVNNEEFHRTRNLEKEKSLRREDQFQSNDKRSTDRFRDQVKKQDSANKINNFENERRFRREQFEQRTLSKRQITTRYLDSQQNNENYYENHFFRQERRDRNSRLRYRSTKNSFFHETNKIQLAEKIYSRNENSANRRQLHYRHNPFEFFVTRKSIIISRASRSNQLGRDDTIPADDENITNMRNYNMRKLTRNSVNRHLSQESNSNSLDSENRYLNHKDRNVYREIKNNHNIQSVTLKNHKKWFSMEQGYQRVIHQNANYQSFKDNTVTQQIQKLTNDRYDKAHYNRHQHELTEITSPQRNIILNMNKRRLPALHPQFQQERISVGRYTRSRLSDRNISSSGNKIDTQHSLDQMTRKNSAEVLLPQASRYQDKEFRQSVNDGKMLLNSDTSLYNRFSHHHHVDSAIRQQANIQMYSRTREMINDIRNIEQSRFGLENTSRKGLKLSLERRNSELRLKEPLRNSVREIYISARTITDVHGRSVVQRRSNSGKNRWVKIKLSREYVNNLLLSSHNSRHENQAEIEPFKVSKYDELVKNNNNRNHRQDNQGLLPKLNFFERELRQKYNTIYVTGQYKLNADRRDTHLLNRDELITVYSTAGHFFNFYKNYRKDITQSITEFNKKRMQHNRNIDNNEIKQKADINYNYLSLYSPHDFQNNAITGRNSQKNLNRKSQMQMKNKMNTEKRWEDRQHKHRITSVFYESRRNDRKSNYERIQRISEITLSKNRSNKLQPTSFKFTDDSDQSNFIDKYNVSFNSNPESMHKSKQISFEEQSNKLFFNFHKIAEPLLLVETENEKWTSVPAFLKTIFSKTWGMKEETKVAVAGSVAFFFLTSHAKMV